MKVMIKTMVVVLEIFVAVADTSWGVWEACSRSCGSGHQRRVRKCNNNNVSPRLTGSPCKDDTIETRLCKTEKCPATKSIIGRAKNNQIISLKYSDGKLICVVESSMLSQGHISWYKDNEEITDSNILINRKTLSLTHVKDNDEHEYTCKFAYNLSSVFSETMLIKRNKHANAVIMKKHRTKTVSLNYENGVLACVVKPSKSFDTNITWYRDSEEIKERELFIDDATLNLKKVTDNQEHDYSCEISSKDGSQFSKHLLINGKTYIGLDVANASRKFGVVKLDENQTINFKASCVVRSYPKAELHFLKNEEIISSNDRINITKHDFGKDTLYQLTIRNISEEDIGEYHCLASNDYISKMIPVNAIIGDGKCSPLHHWKCPTSSRCLSKSSCISYEQCILYYCDIPAEPKHIKAANVTYRSAVLSWWMDPKALEYTIIVDTDNTLSQAFQTQKNKLALDDLRNGSEYSITLYSSNKRGMSGEVYFGFKTKRMVPPAAIRNPVFIRNEFDGNKSTIFKWDVPDDDGMSNEEGNLYYKMMYCIYGNKSCTSLITNVTSLDLSNINHGHLYLVSITAINNAGQEGKVSNMFYRTSNSTTRYNLSHGISLFAMSSVVWIITCSTFLLLS